MPAGKFDNASYKVSGGLHGVGSSVVNALSERLDLESSWRNEQTYQQSYERGKPHGRPRGHRQDAAPRHEDSPSSPTRRLFETSDFSFDTLAQRLRELAFLNAGITITLDDRARRVRGHRFHYDGGPSCRVRGAPEQETGPH